MKIKTGLLTALVFVATVAPYQVEAKGCIKGAIVGGVAGHMAGGHGGVGAAAGCAIGHHEANKPGPSQESPPASQPK